MMHWLCGLILSSVLGWAFILAVGYGVSKLFK
jgi:hypothetical protein